MPTRDGDHGRSSCRSTTAGETSPSACCPPPIATSCRRKRWPRDHRARAQIVGLHPQFYDGSEADGDVLGEEGRPVRPEETVRFASMRRHPSRQVRLPGAAGNS